MIPALTLLVLVLALALALALAQVITFKPKSGDVNIDPDFKKAATDTDELVCLSGPPDRTWGG